MMEPFDETAGLYDLDQYANDEQVQEYTAEDDPDIYQDTQEESYSDFESDEDNQSVDYVEDEVSSDFLTDYLYNKGININSIPIYDEVGNLSYIPFNELSDVEKTDFLNSINQAPISDQELDTINFLRQNKVNLADYVEGQKKQAVADYLKQNQSFEYTVDKLSDEDLYRFVIQEQYPDLSEAEIEDELLRALDNEALFQKKIAKVRKEYKDIEDNRALEAEQLQIQEKEKDWEDMAESIVNYARNTPVLHDLELSDDDKNEVLSFLLDKDVNGQTEFFKLFSDPEALFRLAWYATKGDMAFNTVNNYYQGVIEKTRRESRQALSNSTRTVRRKPSNNNSSYQHKDAFGLDSYFKN